MKGIIVAEPIFSVKKMRGFIKTKKTLSKQEMKKIIKNASKGKLASFDKELLEVENINPLWK